MKTELTPKQSQRLIELGVDPSNASSSTKVYEQLTEKVRWESKVPIFTLSDILSLVPKEIDGYPLLILAKQFFEQTNKSLRDGRYFTQRMICPQLLETKVFTQPPNSSTRSTCYFAGSYKITPTKSNAYERNNH